MDHLLPLYVREAGGLVVYVPDAIATDRPISGLREQLRNRTRTATRGIRANLSMVGALAPWRRPARPSRSGPQAAALGHPWFVLVIAATGLVLGLGGSRSISCTAGVARSRPRPRRPPAHQRGPPSMATGPFMRSFAVVNLAFATGWLNVVRGREIEVWHRAEIGRRRELRKAVAPDRPPRPVR